MIIERLKLIYKQPKGWTLMAYEKNGKWVCRYFY